MCLTKKFYTNTLFSSLAWDSFSSRPGVLYGQTKVQKPFINNFPSFRPILDAINTPAYKLAKFLVPVLSPLAINEYTVNDSFAFTK